MLALDRPAAQKMLRKGPQSVAALSQTYKASITPPTHTHTHPDQVVRSLSARRLMTSSRNRCYIILNAATSNTVSNQTLERE